MDQFKFYDKQNKEILWLLALSIYILSILTEAWANNADPDQMLQNFFFPENRHRRFMQIVSWGDNLHEMSVPIWNIFLAFPETRLWHYMQIVSWGDNLHEMSKPIFWKNKKKKKSNCHLQRFSPSMLSINLPWPIVLLQWTRQISSTLLKFMSYLHTKCECFGQGPITQAPEE